MRIAYLCNRYPAISLTFILREVRALRELGVRVDTFAIRRAIGGHLRSTADREEFASTYAVLPPSPVALLRAHASAFALHPLRYLGTLALALRLRPRGLRGIVWQCFYFAESMVIWRECRRRGIHHIHAQFANVATDVALLASQFGGGRRGTWSWSFTLHGPVEFYDVSQSRLAEKLKRARFAICISDFARSQAMAFLDQREWSKLHVVHCGVDPAVFRPAEESPERPQPGGLRVLNVGRLIPLKGHAELLRAIATLRERGIGARLTLVGDGPDRARLESLAAELDVAEATTFTGAVGQDEIAELYRAADVFCTPSFAEGVPVVLMEAMAMQIPVVATRIAGIPELVEHEVSGLIVSPGRPDQLAAALEELALDPDRSRAFGAAGRAKVSAEFDVRRSAHALRAIFAAELGFTASAEGTKASGQPADARASLQPAAGRLDHCASESGQRTTEPALQ
jgi:glycosyltransferase involved in cell wall biosynthesis